MEPEQTPGKVLQEKQSSVWTTVTPVSKYLAMLLFVVLPFIGGWIGYSFAPEKVVEVEKIVEFEPSTSEESHLQVPETVRLSTTTLDMVTYSIRYSEDKVELLKGPNIVQTIPWDTTYREFYTDKESLLITNWDINFDGYLDLGILSNVGYGGVNRFYHFYTFNTETYVLEKVEDFATFESDSSQLINPSIDIGEQIITTNAKSGPDWVRTQYVFDGNSYVRDDEWINRYGVQKDDEISLSRSSEGTLAVLYSSGIISYTDDTTDEVSEIMTINPSPNVFVFNNKIYTGTKNRVFEIDPFTKTERAIEGTDFEEDVWIPSAFIHEDSLYYLVVTNGSICESPQVACDSRLYRKNLSSGQVEHLVETTATNIMGYSQEEELLYLGGFCTTGIFTYGDDGLQSYGKWCQIDVTDQQFAEIEQIKESISEKLGNPMETEAIQVSGGKLQPSSKEVNATAATVHFYQN